MKDTNEPSAFVSDLDREIHAFLLARGYRYTKSPVCGTYYYRRFTQEEINHWDADKCQLVLNRYDWTDYPETWESNRARVSYEMELRCETEAGFAAKCLLYSFSPTTLISHINTLEESALSVWRLLSRKDRGGVEGAAVMALKESAKESEADNGKS